MSKNIPTPPEGWTQNGLYVEREGDDMTPKPKGVECVDFSGGWRIPIMDGTPMYRGSKYRLPWPGEGYVFVELNDICLKEDERFSLSGGWGAIGSHWLRTSSIPVRRKIKKHNPHNISPEELEESEGYRLLDEDELVESLAYGDTVQAFDGEKWTGGWGGYKKDLTFRTKLTREELRKARGIEDGKRFPEGIKPPFNQEEAKEVAASAPTATEITIELLQSTIRAKQSYIEVQGGKIKAFQNVIKAHESRIEKLEKESVNLLDANRKLLDERDFFNARLKETVDVSNKQSLVSATLQRRIDDLEEENRRLKHERDEATKIADQNGALFDSMEKKLTDAYAKIQEHINEADDLRKERDELVEAMTHMIQNPPVILSTGNTCPEKPDAAEVLKGIIDVLLHTRAFTKDHSEAIGVGSAIEIAQAKLIQILSKE